jgi:uncharacterized membrane protein (DUF485 family)
MSSPDAHDLTPISGSATDIAPLGRDVPKPAHELTGPEEIDAAHWDNIAESADFKKLLKDKARFIIPATIFFVVYYFALPLLVGYAPHLMETKVWGNVNVAYLFALSQFFMAWGIALLYVVVAAGWDRTAAELITRFAPKK